MATVIPSDPRTWDLAIAKSVIAAQKAHAESKGVDYTINSALVEDMDHWRNTEGYVGPLGDAAVRSTMLEGVQRQFVVVDVVREVAQRYVNGLLKREASVMLVPLEPIEPDEGAEELTPEQEAQAAELAAEGDAILEALSGWWDTVHYWAHAKKATARARWATWATMRLWIAEKWTTGPQRAARSLAEALSRVQVVAPLPDAACVYIVPETQERVAVVLSADAEGKEIAEVWYVEPSVGDRPGRTVARRLTADSSTEFPTEMRGLLPVAQMEADLLITEGVRSQQKRLNYIESIVTRVIETSGHRERYIISAAPVGVWTTSPPTDRPVPAEGSDELLVDANGATWYFHPLPALPLGPAKTVQLRGHTYDMEDGRKGITTPSVTFADPVDPAFAIAAAFHSRRTILQSCHQGHVLADSSAAPSGYSREQARADFEDDLDKGRSALETVIRDTLTALLAIASAMGAPKVLDRFRVQVEVHVNSGPLSPDEQRVIYEQWKAGAISAETALSRLGVEDVAAELQRLKDAESARLALVQQRATAMRELADAGVPWEAAMRLVGFSDDEVEAALSTPSTTRPDDEVFPELERGGNGNGRPPEREEEEEEVTA